MKTEQIQDEFDDNSLNDNIVHIFIGQNAQENDKLFKMAKQNDIFFHLNSGPSAHVWLTNCSLPSKQLLNKCAQYVHENSKCVSTAKVIYISKKHLKKGDKPGSVILQRTPTIIH